MTEIWASPKEVGNKDGQLTRAALLPPSVAEALEAFRCKLFAPSLVSLP